jgi:hypothetical protein
MSNVQFSGGPSVQREDRPLEVLVYARHGRECGDASPLMKFDKQVR